MLIYNRCLFAGEGVGDRMDKSDLTKFTTSERVYFKWTNMTFVLNDIQGIWGAILLFP